jgi:hypothetical protein
MLFPEYSNDPKNCLKLPHHGKRLFGPSDFVIVSRSYFSDPFACAKSAKTLDIRHVAAIAVRQGRQISRIQKLLPGISGIFLSPTPAGTL